MVLTTRTKQVVEIICNLYLVEEIRLSYTTRACLLVRKSHAKSLKDAIPPALDDSFFPTHTLRSLGPLSFQSFSLHMLLTALILQPSARCLRALPSRLHSTNPTFHCSLSKPHHQEYLVSRKMTTAPLAPSLTAMQRRLLGRTILITGASSGIGRFTALEFARTAPQDLKLILVARRLEKLRELCEEIRREVGEGVKCFCHAVDVGSEVEVAEFASRLERLADGKEKGFEVGWRVDCLVNNA